MLKIKKFLEKWGLHIIFLPTTLAFLFMAVSTFLLEFDTRNSIVYTMAFGLSAFVYLFFWFERINIGMIHFLLYRLEKQNIRQRELLDAIRYTDKVNYELIQVTENQIKISKEILDILEPKKKKKKKK